MAYDFPSALRWLGFAGALALPALLAPACSNNPAAGLCRDVCDCEGCSEKEEDDCIEAADEAQQDAENEGCTEQFDAYTDCLDDSFKCDDDRAVFTHDCNLEAADLSECGATVPVAGNLCDRAATICGGGGGNGGLECRGAAECAATCIVDANSCDLNDPDLQECITFCS